MKKTSVIVVDDELLAIQRLVNLIKDVEQLNILETCNTGKKAIAKINSLEPDLLFLDIQLKDMTGFDILNQISTTKKPIVIFVSAYDDFALQAFDYFAFDYLLKPYKDDRFYESVTKALELLNQNTTYDFEEKINSLLNYLQNTGKTDDVITLPMKKLPVKLGNKVSFLNTPNIKYILASGYYAEIYIDAKKHLLRESLSNLIEKLNSNEFVRIHRSTIVNISFITELVHSSYGEIDVKMTDGRLFRISKGYKKEFQKLMGI